MVEGVVIPDIIFPKGNDLYILVNAVPTHVNEFTFLHISAQGRSRIVSPEKGITGGEFVRVHHNPYGYDSISEQVEKVFELLESKRFETVTQIITENMGASTHVLSFRQFTDYLFENSMTTHDVFAVVQDDKFVQPIGFNQIYAFQVSKVELESLLERAYSYVTESEELKHNCQQKTLMMPEFNKTVVGKFLFKLTGYENFSPKEIYDEIYKANIDRFALQFEAALLLKSLYESGFDFKEFEVGKENTNIMSMVQQCVPYEQMVKQRFYRNDMITDFAADSIKWGLIFSNMFMPSDKRMELIERTDFDVNCHIGRVYTQETYNLFLEHYKELKHFHRK